MVDYAYDEAREQRRRQRRKLIRRQLIAVLCLGLIAGFAIGRLSARAGYGLNREKQTETAEESADDGVEEETAVTGSKPISRSSENDDAMTYLGLYRVSAYCSCEICSGERSTYSTGGIVYGASGIELKEGVSCASPLPYGTVVDIDGVGEFTVQDREADWAIREYGEEQIDIYFENHEDARAFGEQYLRISARLADDEEN
jgi:3D (Asp-Asp-Asp) domain-containing protein